MKTLSVCGYPGGKVKAVPFLLSRFPKPITEFREIFCGGGSVSLAVMERYPKAKFWMNDLHYPVYAFWKTLRESPHEMVRWLMSKNIEYEGRNRELFDFCKETFKESDEFENACKWWIGQKLSFSMLGFNGTFSTGNSRKFNAGQIFNLLDVSYFVQSVDLTITNHDYSECLSSGDAVIFADPPYLIDCFLYGHNGKLHRDFNHDEFALRMKSCSNPWLITYNDCEDIRASFADFNLEPLDLAYTMGSKRTGLELIITNYDTARAMGRRKAETVFARG